MLIDMTPQVDYSNIASSGEISMSMRMAEIALIVFFISQFFKKGQERFFFPEMDTILVFCLSDTFHIYKVYSKPCHVD